MTSEWFNLLPSNVSSSARPIDAEMAWPLSIKDSVLLALQSCGFAVLGGDVYKFTGTDFQPAYANWSCESLNSERWPNYVERSSAVAKQYLSQFPQNSPLWFVPVVAVKPDAQHIVRSYTL